MIEETCFARSSEHVTLKDFGVFASRASAHDDAGHSGVLKIVPREVGKLGEWVVDAALEELVAGETL